MTGWPPILKRPQMPDLRAGSCLPGRSALPPAAWGEYAGPAQREAAVRICQSCPVLTTCREWALGGMSESHFAGVIAAMNLNELRAERARHRRADNGP